MAGGFTQGSSKQCEPLLRAIAQLKRVSWEFSEAIDEELEDRFAEHEVRCEEYDKSRFPMDHSDRREHFFRNDGVSSHLAEWAAIPKACYAILRAFHAAGALVRLASQAGLEHVGSQASPSDWIEWKVEELSPTPPLSLAQFTKAVGGSHLVGCRLLWWCAAAKSPTEFGYSSWDRNGVMFGIPLWTRVKGNEVVSDRSLINLMVAEATRLADPGELDDWKKANLANATGSPENWPEEYFQEEGGTWLTARHLKDSYDIPNSRLKVWRERGCPDLGNRPLQARKEPVRGWVYYRMDVHEIAGRRSDRKELRQEAQH